MQFIANNNAGTTLAATVNTSQTTITVQPGTGALFPSPAAGQYFACTLIPQTSSTGLPNEIVYVTSVAGDTFTCLRAQEGTSAQSWNVGDFAQNLWTAGQAESLVQTTQLQQQQGNYANDTGTANAGVITLTPVPASLASLIGSPIRVLKISSANTGAYTLNVNGLGATAVTLPASLAMTGGELKASGVFQVIYDGTRFELQSFPAVLQPNQVLNSQLNTAPTLTLKGNNTGITANVVDITISQLQTMLANDVTNAMLAQGPAFTVKGNNTASTANEVDITVAQLLTMLGIVIATQAQFSNAQTSGTTSGEALGSGSFTQRVLNTTVVNNIAGASLSSNQVSLPAGTYLCTGTALTQATGSVTNYTAKSRLQNITGATTLIDGTNNGYAGGSNAAVVITVFQGMFTLGSTSTVEVDTYVTTACNGGPAVSSGIQEVYVNVFFNKIG